MALNRLRRIVFSKIKHFEFVLGLVVSLAVGEIEELFLSGSYVYGANDANSQLAPDTAAKRDKTTQRARHLNLVVLVI